MTNSQSYSDQHLKDLLQSNCKEDLSTFYNLCAAPLFGIIFDIIASQPLAEQVLTEVFLKITQPSFYMQNSMLRLFTRMINLARKTALEKMKISTTASPDLNADRLNPLTCFSTKGEELTL